MDAYTKSSVRSYPSGGPSELHVRDFQYQQYYDSVGPASGNKAVYLNSLSGYRNPMWRDQVRNGIGATTPLVATLYDITPIYIDLHIDAKTHHYANPAYSNQWWGSFQGFITTPIGTLTPDSVPSSVVTDVTNRCIRRFIAKVNEIRSSGNLTGRSLKHLQHDLHSVANPLPQLRGRIASYLERLTKTARSYRGPKSRLLDDIRSAYLEFEFGLRPFSEDLTEILIDVSRQRDYDTYPIKASATATFAGVKATASLVPYVGYASTLQPWMVYSTTSEYSLRYQGAVRTGRNANGKVGWFQDNRLLPQDWLPTAVSILPYDWLVNYFVNVNDLVDGLSFAFANLAWAQKTSRNIKTAYFESARQFTAAEQLAGWPYYVVDYDNSYIDSSPSTSTGKTITRSALTPSDLVPSLTFKVPTKPLQYVNMLAAFLPQIRSILSFL